MMTWSISEWEAGQLLDVLEFMEDQTMRLLWSHVGVMKE